MVLRSPGDYSRSGQRLWHGGSMLRGRRGLGWMIVGWMIIVVAIAAAIAVIGQLPQLWS